MVRGFLSLKTISVLLFVAFALLLVVASHSLISPVSACDPNDPTTWPDLVTSFYSAKNVVAITSAQTDKTSYMVGDKVIVSGTVTLTYKETDVISSVTCGFSEYVQNSSPADPSGVTITIGGNQFAVSSSGSFSATLTLPDSVKAGTYNFPVTATMPTSTVETNFGAIPVDGDTNNRNTNNFDVVNYNPTLTATIANGGGGYPGDMITVSGIGWNPDPTQPITVTFLGSTQTAAGPQFQGLSFTISDDAPKGPQDVAATQGTLSAHATINVQYHAAVVSINPSTLQVKQGDPIPFTLTVTCNGKPAAATFSVAGFGSEMFRGTTDADGTASYDGVLGDTVIPATYPITAMATPLKGCDKGSATSNIVVSELTLTDKISRGIAQMLSLASDNVPILLVVIIAIIAAIVLSKKEWRQWFTGRGG